MLSLLGLWSDVLDLKCEPPSGVDGFGSVGRWPGGVASFD